MARIGTVCHRNTDTVTLVKEKLTVPADYPYIGGDTIVPLRAVKPRGKCF